MTVITIRDEDPGEGRLLTHLVDKAFLTADHRDGTEGAIVAALHESGHLSLCLVAQVGTRRVGCAAFSPVTLSDGARDWFGLGPVAVLEPWRRRGIGARLVETGLTRLRGTGASGCVVLGDPAYYGRFGFESDPALTFADMAPGPFQRLVFTGPAPRGETIYAPAFYGS